MSLANDENSSDEQFAKQITPILKKRCFRCHGDAKAEGNVRLERLSIDLVKNNRAAETWHDALNALNRGEMPPENAPALTSKERKLLVGWLTSRIEHAIKAKKRNGGQIVLRRLNRVEYQNTMRDLLGLDLDFASDLPPDGTNEAGFKNDGSTLKMSALQLEYYLKAARKGLQRAIVTTEEPEVHKHTEVKSVKDKVNNNWTMRLGRSGIFAARVLQFPSEGEFRIRIKAHGEFKDDSPYPRMKIVFGYRADTQTPSREIAVVDVSSTESKVYEFRGRIEEYPQQSRTQSKYPGQLVWITNAYKDGKPPLKAKQVKGKGKKKERVWPEDPDFPKIVIESVEFEAPVFESWPPRHHSRILPVADESKNEVERCSQAVLAFMRRAFRRDVQKDEAADYVAYFNTVRPTTSAFEEAMRETLAMVLISPDFLYLVEPQSGGSRPISDFELASRLSYFLWSSMPDEELLKLSSNAKLSDDKILDSQVQRMLESPKSAAFLQQFSNQWLDLDGVDRVAVNPEFYPNFDNALKPDMRKETQAFFAEVVGKNLSIVNFLQSDFTMLNEPLAKHYGIVGPRGGSFERVALKRSDRRGGLLSHASILLSNSTGEDSHVIKRAVWIRDRLLNDPPAPPPPDVPDLSTSNPDFAKLSLKEQLTQHRENAACANCHKAIDPWGIALEDTDAIGLFRSEVRRRVPGKRNKTSVPVDAKTTLPNGQTVNGIDELKAVLLSRYRSEFARAFTAKLLTYALGRSLELTDEDTVAALTTTLEENEYRIQPLIHAIVKREVFRVK